LIQIKATSGRSTPSSPPQVKVMARYYFHFWNGILFEDDVGEEFADASNALQHAKRVARELAEDGRSDSAIIVTKGGCPLFEIPLSTAEVDPVRQKRHAG
jgi:hypothetical protein